MLPSVFTANLFFHLQMKNVSFAGEKIDSDRSNALKYISGTVKLNVSVLSNKLQINRDIILTIIFQLERGKILNLLGSFNSGFSI
jgi:hypothetical protein